MEGRNGQIQMMMRRKMKRKRQNQDVNPPISLLHLLRVKSIRMMKMLYLGLHLLRPHDH